MLSEKLNINDLTLMHDFYSEILLVAPTGAGKTSLLIDYFQQNNKSILYVSPLRALADECFIRLQDEFGSKRVLRLNDRKNIELCLDKIKNDQKIFAIGTVENFPDGFFEALQALEKDLLVVFDEIHLFFHWGEGFRPVLLERYYEVKFFEFKVLSLTATFSKDHLEVYEQYAKMIGLKTISLDLGNYGLKKNPQKINYYHQSQKKLLMKSFWRKLYNKKIDETIMVFVAYRNEVDDLISLLRKSGFRSLGCVSGEVANFKKELDYHKGNELKIDVIVATTCLSHGVNLPALNSVFLLYPIQHRDFWIQMVGRAGRRGEEFEVYEMNGFNEQGQLRKKNTLRVLALKNMMKNTILELWG